MAGPDGLQKTALRVADLWSRRGGIARRPRIGGVHKGYSPSLYVPFHRACRDSSMRQDGGTFPPAGGKVPARMCSFPPSIDPRVERARARTVRASCPKLEPLIERPFRACSNVQE